MVDIPDFQGQLSPRRKGDSNAFIKKSEHFGHECVPGDSKFFHRKKISLIFIDLKNEFNKNLSLLGTLDNF